MRSSDMAIRRAHLTTMKCSVVIISLLITFGAGAPKQSKHISERIAGGSLAADGEFPYIASIQVDHRHICSGFIYSDNWIVTTASCIFGRLPSQLLVVVGISSLSTPGDEQQTIPVHDIKSYADYDPTLKLHDLALLLLSRPVVFGSLVQYLRYDELDTSVNTAVTMGWGSTTDGGIEVTKLRKTTLDVTSVCSSYSSSEYDPNYAICAGSETSSPCQYDEGSPLVQNGIAVGIMSKNQGCASPYVPSIFTRLSAYYFWLNQTAGQQPPPKTTPGTPTTTTSQITTPTTPTTTKMTIPTAPCFNCETLPPTTTTTAKPPIPTAPCFNCVPDVPFVLKH